MFTLLNEGWHYLPQYTPIVNAIVIAISPIMVHLISHHVTRNGNVITRAMALDQIDQFFLSI